MPSRISLQASGSNVYLNGSNLNIEITGGGGGGGITSLSNLPYVDTSNLRVDSISARTTGGTIGFGNDVNFNLNSVNNAAAVETRTLALYDAAYAATGEITYSSASNTLLLNGTPMYTWTDHIPTNVYFSNVWTNTLVPTIVKLRPQDYDNTAMIQFFNVEDVYLGRLAVNVNEVSLDFAGDTTFKVNAPTQFNSGITADLDMTSNSIRNVHELSSRDGVVIHSHDTNCNVQVWIPSGQGNNVSYTVGGSTRAIASDWWAFPALNDVNMDLKNVANSGAVETRILALYDPETTNTAEITYRQLSNTLLLNGVPLISTWADHIPTDVYFTNVWASNIIPTIIQLKQREADYSAEVVQFYNVDNTFMGRLGVNTNFVSLDFLEGNTFIVNAPTQFNSGITADLDMSSNSIRHVNEIQLGKTYYSIPDTPDFANVRWWNSFLCYSFNDLDYNAVAGDWFRFAPSQDVDFGSYSITNCAKLFFADTQQPFTQFGVITVATLIDDTSGFPYDIADLTNMGFSDVSLPNAYPDTSYVVQLTAKSIYSKCWVENLDSSSFRVYGRFGYDFAWTAMGLM
jgi:hypothetical protein